jgi:hypothetical protein
MYGCDSQCTASESNNLSFYNVHLQTTQLCREEKIIVYCWLLQKKKQQHHKFTCTCKATCLQNNPTYLRKSLKHLTKFLRKLEQKNSRFRFMTDFAVCITTVLLYYWRNVNNYYEILRLGLHLNIIQGWQLKGEQDAYVITLLCTRIERVISLLSSCISLYGRN